jgi:hypothetical protein
MTDDALLLHQQRERYEEVLEVLAARRAALRWDEATARRHVVEAACLDSMYEALAERVSQIAAQQYALRPKY